MEGTGAVEAAVVYGGAFYIFIEEEKLGLRVLPEQTAALVARAMEMKRWANANLEIRHPEKQEINGIYGVLITSPVERTEYGCRSRHICVFADGSVDRSPCGTGTSAKLALLRARGELPLGKPYVHESILGTLGTGGAAEDTAQGGYPAIVPEITGRAYVTGLAQYLLDPEDPLGGGFLL